MKINIYKPTLWFILLGLILPPNPVWANIRQVGIGNPNLLTVLHPNEDFSSEEPRQDFEDCSVDILQQFLSVEGLNTLLTVVSRLEGSRPKDVLQTLAKFHGLKLQEETRRYSSRFSPKSTLDDVVETQKTMVEEIPNDVTQLLKLISVPKTRTSSVVEIPTPDGLPRAFLMLTKANGDVISRRWIDLAPRTSFLDLLRIAKDSDDFNDLQTKDDMLDFKMKKIKSKRCLGLAFFGPLKATPPHPLVIKIYNAALQVVWEDSCLPKVADILIYSGYVVTVSPAGEQLL